MGEDLTQPLDYDALKECTLLERCLKETLRLRPGTLSFMRMCKTPQVITSLRLLLLLHIGSLRLNSKQLSPRQAYYLSMYSVFAPRSDGHTTSSQCGGCATISCCLATVPPYFLWSRPIELSSRKTTDVLRQYRIYSALSRSPNPVGKCGVEYLKVGLQESC